MSDGTGATVWHMPVDTRSQVRGAEPEGDLTVDLVEALRPRLADLPADTLRHMVEAAVHDLGEVRVTTYLPILVERTVRERLRDQTRDDVVRLPA